MQQNIEFEGLSHQQVLKNSELYGKNTLPEKEKASPFVLFLKQFKSPFIYILLFVAGISVITGEYTDAIVIFAILIINAVVGTTQEHRANNAVSALRKLSQPKTKVVRDGELLSIHTSEVTVGDIVFLEPGDVVPADGQLVSSDYLGINESSLNGESLPVVKEKENEPVYKSTVVVSGKGFIKIEKIGLNTIIGALAQDIDKNQNKIIELQKKINSFSFKLLLILGGASTLFLTVALYKGTAFIETVKTVGALGVAVIPEGLPIVLTIVLSLGALQISRARALLRNLPSGATLASVSTICTDKTGTLTYGDVSVREIVYIDSSSLSQDDKKDFVYHSLDIKNIMGKKSGDTLDLVMETFLERQTIFQETKESPFTSEAKFNAKEYIYGDKVLQIYKGASESLGVGGQQIDHYTQEGFRVLSVGYKILNKQQEFSVEGIEPLALVIFEDKIREEVQGSIVNCKKTGINIIMMTGDNILTAKHVALKVGIITSEKDVCIVGKDLDLLTDEQVKHALGNIKVIARVTPTHKERIVQLLQEKGEIVAMTGDGVNDGPALSLANIGISMGKSGTDVAREASDLVLLNDDFSDIVFSIFEARTIAENIRKALVFLMTSATGLIALVLGSTFFGLPLPLLPVQILWLNFITAGLLDVAIATENSEAKYKTYTFKRYRGGLLNHYDMGRILVVGLTLGAVTLLAMFSLNASFPIEVTRTILLVLFSVGIWFHAFNVRKNYDTLGTYNIFGNIYVTAAVCLEAVILVCSIYLPIGNKLLHTISFPVALVPLLLILGGSVIVSDYLYKKVAKKTFLVHST